METQLRPDIDHVAVEQWRSMLGLYFRSMELGLQELLALASEVPNTSQHEWYQRAKVRCHALKGASALAGFRGVARRLQTLEDELEEALRGKRDLSNRTFYEQVVRTWEDYQRAKAWVMQQQEGANR